MTMALHGYVPSSRDLPTGSTTTLTAIGALAALSAAWVAYDYTEWLATGTGGTPPTPSGYWRMTKFRWRCFWSKDDLRDASPIGKEGPKYLDDLPQRPGKRPQVLARTMPQRQKPEPLDSAARERLRKLPKSYCDSHPQILVYDLSKTEGRSTDAIYAKPDLPGRHASATDKMLGNEIAHVHPVDNSLHVWLSAPDATQVVDKGWGERFPLSSLGLLHPSWVMVYAPRSMSDVDVIEDIVKAGIGYLTGEKL